MIVAFGCVNKRFAVHQAFSSGKKSSHQGARDEVSKIVVLPRNTSSASFLGTFSHWRRLFVTACRLFAHSRGGCGNRSFFPVKLTSFLFYYSCLLSFCPFALPLPDARKGGSMAKAVPIKLAWIGTAFVVRKSERYKRSRGQRKLNA